VILNASFRFGYFLKLIQLSAILLVVSFSLSQPVFAQKPASVLTIANTLTKSDRFQRVAQFLENSRQKWPSSSTLPLILGYSYFYFGYWAKAAQEFKTACKLPFVDNELVSDESELHKLLGFCYYRQQKYAEAISEFENRAGLDEDHPLIVCAKRRASGKSLSPDLMQLERLAELQILPLAPSLLEADPANTLKYSPKDQFDLHKAFTLENHGDFKTALNVLEKGTHDFPKNIDLVIEFANCTVSAYPEPENNHHIDEAISALKIATKISPNDWRLWNNLGTLQTRVEKTDEALVSLKRALACSPPAWAREEITQAYQRIPFTLEQIKKKVEEEDEKDANVPRTDYRISN